MTQDRAARKLGAWTGALAALPVGLLALAYCFTEPARGQGLRAWALAAAALAAFLAAAAGMGAWAARRMLRERGWASALWLGALAGAAMDLAFALLLALACALYTGDTGYAFVGFITLLCGLPVAIPWGLATGALLRACLRPHIR